MPKVAGLRSERTLAAALVLALTLAAAPVRAQDWQMRSYDDGSFFAAGISEPQSGVALLCGERSAGGLSAAQTGNMEPEITAPDSLRLSFSLDDLKLADPMIDTRRDLIVAAGGQGFRLPPLRMNELVWTWEADLAATDPVFAAIASVPSFAIHSDAGVMQVSARGFEAAHAQLLYHCQTMFASIGRPWASAPRVTPRQAAEAALVSGCSGPADAGPSAYLEGEIDGDGVPDIVLDWGEATCRTGPPRPFCGASMCSASVFLSSRPDLDRGKLELLAVGVRLQPLSNGNMAVAVGGSLAQCSQSGGTACEFLYYWDGADLAELR